MLGTILFAMLLVVLLIYVFQKRALTTLFPFFLLPVVMIGFPAFQKISYANGTLELEKSVQKVTASGGDAKAAAELMKDLNRVAPRAAGDPNASLAVARAYKALGEPQRALEAVEAIPEKKRPPAAVKLGEELRRNVVVPAKPGGG